MTVSDAQYAAWLGSPQATRVILVEAEYFLGSVQTLRLASQAFVSWPTDTPPNTPYDERLAGVPVLLQSLGVALNGRSQITVGSVDITDVGGDLDWLLDAHFGGRPLRVKLGDPAWPLSDYRTVFSGICAALRAVSDGLELSVRGAEERLNKPLQSATVAAGPNAGQLKPLCFGTCFNLSPVLVDPASHRYQVHDGAIGSISAVRVNGAPVSFTPSLSTGTFTLSAESTGTVTCDAVGATATASTCAALAPYLAQTYGGLAGAEIDGAAWTALATAAPYALGLYIDDRRNILEVLDEICASVGADWFFDAQGRLSVMRLAAPTGQPVVTLLDDDIDERSLQLKAERAPYSQVRVGYARNWTKQGSVDASVSETNRARYEQAYSIATASNPGIASQYPNAEQPPVFDSLLVNAADAQAEASRLLALFDRPRRIFAMSTRTGAYSGRLGDVFSLDHPRYGFAGGRLGVCVRFDLEPTSRSASIELFR